MKRISLLLLLGLTIISLASCRKAETRERILPNDKKVLVDANGRILMEGKAEPLDVYTYYEETGRYINEATGIWYVIQDGYKVIPPEEYIDPSQIDKVSGINISDRPNDVWELKEIREITIEPGDTLVDIINPYVMNEHFRMDYEWYAKQVLKLNNITDPHLIKAGDTLKMPIYIDKGAEDSRNDLKIQDCLNTTNDKERIAK